MSTWVTSQARHTVPRYWLVNISDLVSSVHFFFVIIVCRYCHLWLQISWWFNPENFSHKFSGNSDILNSWEVWAETLWSSLNVHFVFCSYSKFLEILRSKNSGEISVSPKICSQKDWWLHERRPVFITSITTNSKRWTCTQ